MLNLKKLLAKMCARLAGLQNLNVIEDVYYGSNTSGVTNTFTLEHNCMYLVCAGRVNSNVAPAAYLVTSRDTAGNIATLASSSFETITISGLTLTATFSANFVRLVILKIGGGE